MTNMGVWQSPYCWSFPQDLSAVFEASFASYNLVAKALGAYLGVALTYRGTLALVNVEGTHRFTELLKDLVTYSLLVIIAPDLIRLLSDFSMNVAHALVLDNGMHDAVRSKIEASNSIFGLFKSLTSLDWVLMAVDAIPHAIWWLSAEVSLGLASILVTTTPLVIFFSTVAKVHSALRTLVATFISLLCWPILWNLIALNYSHVIDSVSTQSPFFICFYTISSAIFQLFSPLALELILLGVGSGAAVVGALAIATSFRRALPSRHVNKNQVNDPLARSADRTYEKASRRAVKAAKSGDMQAVKSEISMMRATSGNPRVQRLKEEQINAIGSGLTNSKTSLSWLRAEIPKREEQALKRRISSAAARASEQHSRPTQHTSVNTSKFNKLQERHVGQKPNGEQKL